MKRVLLKKTRALHRRNKQETPSKELKEKYFSCSWLVTE
jgi:hypothetical protein